MVEVVKSSGLGSVTADVRGLIERCLPFIVSAINARNVVSRISSLNIHLITVGYFVILENRKLHKLTRRLHFGILKWPSNVFVLGSIFQNFEIGIGFSEFLDWDRFFRISGLGSIFQNFGIGIDFSEFRDWDRFFRILGLGSIFQNFGLGSIFQNFGIGIRITNSEKIPMLVL